MNTVLVALVVWAAGGALAFALGGRPGVARWVSAVSGVLGSAVGLWASIAALWASPSHDVVLSVPWPAPLGPIAVGLDPLSAFFLLPLFLLGGACALYGKEYLPERKTEGTGLTLAALHFLVAAMGLVVVARHALLFLVAWETMSISAFLLVLFERERPESRTAAWTFLVASQLGTAFLLAMFLLLAKGSESLAFSEFTVAPGLAGVLFVLAVVGFGTKAGFIPLHVWLPEAHPAAPSHASALMSGMMLKTGIYGILRVLTFLGAPSAWWGYLLLAVGVISGVLGVLLALTQHDLKRLLAYHSVENIGIIAIGMGIGVLGQVHGAPGIAALGYCGALLHVLNHAVFKGLLFLGAGAVIHATGTREIEDLGGLARRMPWTALTFLVGSVAICGLPPLNGFVSEFLIYVGALEGIRSDGLTLLIPGVLTLLALALIGGLAAACFAKAFGVVFLGEPRTERCTSAHDPGPAMLIPMVALAGVCVVIGVAAPWGLTALEGPVAQLTGSAGSLGTAGATVLLQQVVLVSAILSALVLGLAVLRWRLLAGRTVGEAGTWGCGYTGGNSRMQYTASSFAQPITDMFQPVLRTQSKLDLPGGFFPEDGRFASEPNDVSHSVLFAPLFRLVDRSSRWLRWIQHGNVHLYVLYIALTLIALLVYHLGGAA